MSEHDYRKPVQHRDGAPGEFWSFQTTGLYATDAGAGGTLFSGRSSGLTALNDSAASGASYATAAESTTVYASGSTGTHGVSLSPTAGGLSMVQFMTGLNSSGQEDTADPNFWNWNQDNPATYTLGRSPSYAHSWAPDSTVTYWFNPASNWSTQEMASFTDALNLWSSIADIHFTLSTSGSQPTDAIVITRGSDGSAETSTNYFYSSGLGRGEMTGATVSIDTSKYGWQSLDSFSAVGGYGVETVTHELGHALGLGHSGPYNGTAQASQVIYTTDTRQYTLMSYVDAGSATAATVAANNGDTASSASYTNSNGTYYLTTAGQYDILAIQRLYGGATSGPLTTAETFGFNASTILQQDLPQYDFTVNTNPVVTIYDTATSGNTLNVSGFSAASTIDLNPGQFSSVNGMTDNIGIAFGTWVDNVVAGGGNDLFYVNGHSDSIDGGGGSNTVVFSGNYSTYTFARNSGIVTVSDAGITDTLSNVQTLQFADQSVATSSLPCFVAGTLIRTPGGDRPVETLREGDPVCTASGEVRPVRWIGRREIDLVRHPHPPAAAPVRIRRGAFGDAAPARDLLVSPDHAVAVEGVLIPSKSLVNDATIVQEQGWRRVCYLHVELDRHDVLLAEGLPVESYLDTGNRAMFSNAGLALILHPDCSVRSRLKRWDQDACAPLVVEGPLLAAVRAGLLRRAMGDAGGAIADPGLRLVADGRPVPPLSGDTARRLFPVPAGARRLHLMSRAAVPAEMLADSRDRRRLGVRVAGISLLAGWQRQDIPVDHPGLLHGWHAVERSVGALWRWTDGSALVALAEPAEPGTLIEIALVESPLTYWAADSRRAQAA